MFTTTAKYNRVAKENKELQDKVSSLEGRILDLEKIVVLTSPHESDVVFKIINKMMSKLDGFISSYEHLRIGDFYIRFFVYDNHDPMKYVLYFKNEEVAVWKGDYRDKSNYIKFLSK